MNYQIKFSICVAVLLVCLINCYAGENKKPVNNIQKKLLNVPKNNVKVTRASINDKTSNTQPHIGFIHGFVASIYVIIISELGDKTFFIAAIMSIRNPRLIVYAGAMLALASMTVLSAALGMATTIIPRKITYYLSGVLFLVFGFKMMKDAYDMSPNDTTEEYEEVQAELKKRESDYSVNKQSNSIDPETGALPPATKASSKPEEGLLLGKLKNFSRIFYMFFSKTFIEAFVLTFLAEWGDRSQMTTIVLAATKDVIGVIIGGTLGHAICTGIAVIAGRFIAQKIPVRALTLIGGITFLLFALHTFVSDPNSNS